MYGHLIAVEVGIEGRTNQWVKLYRLTFDQNRLECLNAEPMQRRGSIEHDRMLANHFFQYVPDFRTLALHQALRSFYGGCLPAELQLRENKRFEQFQGELLRQAALMKL